MQKDNSLSLEESLLNEIYINPNLRGMQRKKKVRYPAVLESIDTQNHQPIVASQSTGSLLDPKTSGFFSAQSSAKSSLNSLKPLPVQDYHRVSDLMHRVSAVSGYAPDQSELSPINKPIPSSNVEIAANMQEYQLKSMKDSNALRETMEKVIQLHQELDNLVNVHLMHRKELSKQIEEINNRYIKLFEISLSEMLRTQRQKFKSQTQDIEQLKQEIQDLQEKLSASLKTAEMQSEKILNLRTALFETDERLCISNAELHNLRTFKNKAENEKQDYEDQLANALGQAKLDYEGKVKKLHMQHKQELSAEMLKFAEERMKLTQKQEKSSAVHESMTKELVSLREKAKALDSLANSVQTRRPLRDNFCQTQVTDEGLWDKQDGWIMPISQTARIRNLWRAAIKFAACPACRGVGKYVHQVGAILRRVKRGKELLKETVVEEDLSKWCLPDECVRFMSNLPKTAQAFRPRSLAWTVRCVFYLYALKYAADREDDALGYLRQPFVEFVIERYLMSTEHRAEAEMRMYHLIRSVREFYPRHPALQMFARFMGILDAVTPEEYAEIQRKNNLNEAALKRKREEGMKQLGARERVKQIKDEERRQARDVVFKNPEQHFQISTKALSMDILSITLYARSCLLYAPYMGVYAVPIALAKRHSAMQQTQAHQLRTLPDATFSANTIIPEVYNPEYASRCTQRCVVVPPRAEDSTGAVGANPRDPVPLHLCVGDKSQHWVPMDRAVNVVRQLLSFLPGEEMTKVYRAMEFNTMFLMENGTLDLPEGTHSLIRGMIRLFATCPVDGGFDLSWHDLYHSLSDLGNQNEYSSHFIKTLAAKETIVPVPEPIVMPIVGSMDTKKSGAGSGDKDSDDSDKDSAADEAEELVIMRRLFYTRDPAAVYLDRKMNVEDYRTACSAAGTVPISGQPWQETNSSSFSGSPQNKLVIQEDLLGNHAHLKHYRHIHPETMMVNLDITLQLVSEAMLNRSSSVGERIRQIFIEGDTNHDGVLSFSEFMDIVKKVAPEYHERKILKMFREALMTGDDNECIGPEAFLEVCTAYGLIKILDINSFAQYQLRALSDPPAVSSQQLSIVRTELKKDQSGKFGSSGGRSFKRERSMKVVTSSFEDRPPLASAASVKVLETTPAPTPKPQKQPPQLASAPRVAPAPAPGVQKKSTHRYGSISKSLELEDDASLMNDSIDELPPAAVEVSKSLALPVAKIGAPPSGSIRVASMGDVCVAKVEKEVIPPKQPVKGRVAQPSTFSAEPMLPALQLSDALHGKSAAMQTRKVPATFAEHKEASKHAASASRLPMDDDTTGFEASPPRRPAQHLQVVMPQVPSPPKVRLHLGEDSEDEVDDELMEDASAEQKYVLDPAVVDDHMKEVRSVKLNESMSKESAQRLLEQLRIKKESRMKRG